jgi:hypothetical protein
VVAGLAVVADELALVDAVVALEVGFELELHAANRPAVAAAAPTAMSFCLVRLG